jgi:hypothetical protein
VRDNFDLILFMSYCIIMMVIMVAVPESALGAVGVTSRGFNGFLLVYVVGLPCLMMLFDHGMTFLDKLLERGLTRRYRLFESRWPRLSEVLKELPEAVFQWHVRSCVFLLGLGILLRVLDWTGVF